MMKQPNITCETLIIDSNSCKSISQLNKFILTRFYGYINLQ